MSFSKFARQIPEFSAIFSILELPKINYFFISKASWGKDGYWEIVQMFQDKVCFSPFVPSLQPGPLLFSLFLDRQSSRTTLWLVLCFPESRQDPHKRIRGKWWSAPWNYQRGPSPSFRTEAETNTLFYQRTWFGCKRYLQQASSHNQCSSTCFYNE